MLDLFGQADCASSHVTGPGWPGDAPLGHDQLAAERDYLGRRDCPHVTDLRLVGPTHYTKWRALDQSGDHIPSSLWAPFHTHV
jgi:hypothetical protein